MPGNRLLYSSSRETITEKLINLRETANPVAKILLEKLEHLTAKNNGSRTAAARARGETISEPAEIAIYSFTPSTTVDLEKFSVACRRLCMIDHA